MKAKNILIIALTFITFNNIIKGQIHFNEHVLDTEVNGISGLQSCDIDGDGYNDIIAASTNSDKIIYYRNDGGIPVSFTKFYVDENFDQALYLCCGDINNDSRPDIAATSSNAGVVAWWKNNGDNPLTWTKQVIETGFDNSHGISICDIDNDGIMDIVATAAGANTIAWWKNDGNENITWTKQIITSSFARTQTVFTTDIDNDGDIDVLGGSSESNEIALWVNNGGDPISWYKYTIGTNFALAHWVYAADVDGDGLTDVIGAAYTSSQIAWWKNDGGDPSNWTKYTIGGVFLGALTVHADDLDNDGDTDLLGTAWVGDDIAVWLNQDDSPVTWSKVTLDFSNNGVWPIITSDLDNDGDVDVITGADVLGGPGTSAPLTWWENELITDVEDNVGSIPTGFELKQNYPNPFNPSTNISFTLKEDSHITLEIYDVTGKLISKLINATQSAGAHSLQWNGRNLHNQKVSAGLYIAKLSDRKSTQQIKMLLLK